MTSECRLDEINAELEAMDQDLCSLTPQDWERYRDLHREWDRLMASTIEVIIE